MEGCLGCLLLGAGAGIVGRTFLGVVQHARASPPPPTPGMQVNSHQRRGVGYREQG